MKVLSLALMASCAGAFVVPAAPRTRGDAVALFKFGGAAAATKPATKPSSTPAAPKVELPPGSYVPDGLTRAQYAEIKAKEAARQKKEKPAKIETLDEWQNAFETGKTGHRFAKMKYQEWYKR